MHDMKAIKIGVKVLALFLAIAVGGLQASNAAAAKQVVLISGETEYRSVETLPPFGRFLESEYGFRCVMLKRVPDKEEIPGLEALEQADLVVLYVRRMTLPEASLAKIRQYVERGGAVVGLRTASHAFQNWKSFDREILGGNYQGHHGNDLRPTIRVAPAAEAHPLLKGVDREFISAGSLYRNAPLPEGSEVVLTGAVSNAPAEPVAWTRTSAGRRVFYTSLGHPLDFEMPAFRTLLVRGIHWAMELPLPASVRVEKAERDLGGDVVVRSGEPKRVGVDAFEPLWKGKRGVLLDVRTAEEYKAGHLAGATLLDFRAPDFEEQLRKLDRDAIYLVHCASGNRSAKACEKMSQLGFRYVVELATGFKGWDSAGKPVER